MTNLLLILLVGCQVLVSTLPYTNCVFDIENTSIELNGTEHSDAEEDDKKEKEKRLKKQFLANFSNLHISNSLFYFIESDYNSATREIKTPPPKL